MTLDLESYPPIKLEVLVEDLMEVELEEFVNVDVVEFEVKFVVVADNEDAIKVEEVALAIEVEEVAVKV